MSAKVWVTIVNQICEGCCDSLINLTAFLLARVSGLIACILEALNRERVEVRSATPKLLAFSEMASPPSRNFTVLNAIKITSVGNLM